MLISLRIPDWLLERIDAEAVGSERSRNSVISRCLQREFNPKETLPWGHVEKKGIDAAGPLEIEAMHALMEQAEPLAESLERYRRRSFAIPSAPSKACPDCGALRGHQKWCKGK